MKKLNDNHKQKCEGELDIHECEDAIKDVCINNKSPGYDGLTVEFNRFFWDKVKYLVVSSLNEGFNQGVMAFSRRKCIIPLIHKR